MKSSHEIIKILEANGWVSKRVNGSHHIFYKEGMKFPITISHPRKNLTIGQIKDIERKSGLKLR
ncbi:type II toxin-antitoxin system HicA family toxin [Eikenella sp. NML99-0057]|uniref:type II toxin-antitoxin system HicA family toxin n=1 Tax=Eikenella sp. NML99-0057 TaxID=1795834 RepID=UPI0009EDF24E|nr:type II toxin-antitoxin system HicA family toxin [Eikenella sp. NML99-0057]